MAPAFNSATIAPVRRGGSRHGGISGVIPWVSSVSLNQTTASGSPKFEAASGSVFAPEYNQAWSVSVLFKINSLASAFLIFSKTKNGAPYSGQVLYINTDGSLDFQFASSQGPNWLRVKTAASTFATDTWYRVTITLDGTGTYAGTKVYINNVDTATINSANTLSATTINTTPIATGHEWTERYRNGKIKDLAWWNTVLTASDELALTTESINLNTHVAANNLQNFWHFETGATPPDTASVVYDRKGSDNLTGQAYVAGDYVADVP